MATAKQKPASHALKPTASLMNPFGGLSLEDPIAVGGAAQEAEAPAGGQLLELDAGSMAQVGKASQNKCSACSCVHCFLGSPTVVRDPSDGGA